MAIFRNEETEGTEETEETEGTAGLKDSFHFFAIPKISITPLINVSGCMGLPGTYRSI